MWFSRPASKRSMTIFTLSAAGMSERLISWPNVSSPTKAPRSAMALCIERGSCSALMVAIWPMTTCAMSTPMSSMTSICSRAQLGQLSCGVWVNIGNPVCKCARAIARCTFLSSGRISRDEAISPKAPQRWVVASETSSSTSSSSDIAATRTG